VPPPPNNSATRSLRFEMRSVGGSRKTTDHGGTRVSRSLRPLVDQYGSSSCECRGPRSPSPQIDHSPQQSVQAEWAASTILYRTILEPVSERCHSEIVEVCRDGVRATRYVIRTVTPRMSHTTAYRSFQKSISSPSRVTPCPNLDPAGSIPGHPSRVNSTAACPVSIRGRKGEITTDCGQRRPANCPRIVEFPPLEG
jgi:hypothetical protein